MSGAVGASGAASGTSYGRGSAAAAPARSFEERAQAKEQMMASVRESSQQERRVYVGNLSYDVKWHHLKDFMRQGKLHAPFQGLYDALRIASNLIQCTTAGEVLFADVLLLPNGMSKVGANV